MEENEMGIGSKKQKIGLIQFCEMIFTLLTNQVDTVSIAYMRMFSVKIVAAHFPPEIFMSIENSLLFFSGFDDAFQIAS